MLEQYLNLDDRMKYFLFETIFVIISMIIFGRILFA